MTTAQESEFQQRMARIDSLIHEIEQWSDPAARSTAQNVVQALLELHGAAIEMIVRQLIELGEPGQAILDACARDPLVGSVMLLHDQHPWPLQRRVEHIIEQLRADLEPRGGHIELMEVSEQAVRVRMDPGGGCGSSGEAMREMVEQAVGAQAPDVATIHVESIMDRPAFVQLTVEHNGEG